MDINVVSSEHSKHVFLHSKYFDKNLEPLVEVLMFGATKYSKDNWKKGQAITELLGSLFRHIIAFQNGEDLDEESGKSHIGHAMCNLMFIQYVLDNHKHFDDRKKGAS